jgi:hypothetical protein
MLQKWAAGQVGLFTILYSAAIIQMNLCSAKTVKLSYELHLTTMAFIQRTTKTATETGN